MSENIQMASMPIEDYKSACDTIREITNSSEVITSGELAKKVEEVYDCDWNKLKDSVSGEIVAVNDVSPIEHEMGVKVRGKNLLNSNLRLTPRTDSGVTIQYLPEEDCYLLNGTSTDRVASLVYEDVFVNDYITITTKVVSGTIDNPNNGYTVFYAGGKNDINDSVSNWVDAPIGYDDNRTSYDIRKYIGCTWFYFDEGITFNNYKVKIQIEKGTTATAYAPYIPDISAVKVMKLGKNLAFAQSNMNSGGITFTKEDDGSVYIKGKATGFVSYYFVTPSESILRENTTYRVSVRYSGILPCDASPVFAFVEDGKQKWQQTVIWNKNCSNPLFYIQFYEGDEVDAHYYFQLEIGSNGTEYEPYIEPTEYTPNADGIVHGVTSIYPTTTLMTDTDGAVIDATYNKKISEVDEVPERIEAVYDEGCIKGERELWDLFTRNNTRTNTSKLFLQSDFEYIRPPYKIRPTSNESLIMTFMDSKIKKLEAAYFDFSQKNRAIYEGGSLYYTFYQCMELEEIEDVGLPADFYLSSTFKYCTKLKKIVKIRVDENTDYWEPFYQCQALEEVTFEGVIAKNDLNFQWSTKLSKASWINIIGCLSTTTSGLSITGSLDSIKKAFETSPGANDGDTSTEWLELETSRSNWKINLL